MSTATIIQTVTLEATYCADCGVAFAAPDWFMDGRREDGKSFYCPNGHSLSYHETDAMRLQKQLETARRNSTFYSERLSETRKDLEAEKRSKAAVKGVLTKTKKRLSGGVCPCCNRTFQNLQRHMSGQHPDFGEGAA